MKRLLHLGLAAALMTVIGCADGLPTAAPDGTGPAAAFAVTALEDPIAVQIDVKPEAVNAGEITVKPNNRLAVALLADNPIDIETVDPSTVVLTIGEATMTLQHDLTKPAAFASHLKDVFPVELPDGEVDYLVFHFDPWGLDDGEFEACLTGLADGVPFSGCEVVTVK
jgi:hypothetical protein